MILTHTHHQYKLFRMLFFGGLMSSTVFLLPLSGVEFTLPKLVLYSLTAAVGTLWLLLRDDTDTLVFFTKHWIGRFLLFYIFLLLLSVSWSSAPFMSVFGSPPRFEGLMTHLVYISFAVCALCLSQHPRGLRNLNKTLLISNALIVVYGILQMIGADPLNHLWQHSAFLGRTFSSLGHPNALGAFIVLTVPFVTFKAISVQGSKETRLFTLLAIANIIVLLGTASRASVLALVVSTGVFLSLASSLTGSWFARLRGGQRIVALFIAIIIL